MVIMKKALISPGETVGNGYRIAEVTASEFPVAPPLFWVDAPDDIEATTHCYVDGEGFVDVTQGAQQETGEGWREATEVSRFQARVALHNFGLFDAVDKALSAPDAPFLAKEAWASASVFKRLSPTVTAMAGILGLTDEQLDELFRAALEIQA